LSEYVDYDPVDYTPLSTTQFLLVPARTEVKNRAPPYLAPMLSAYTPIYFSTLRIRI
jgi:hypothetical protein